jgi:choline dehydrogenase
MPTIMRTSLTLVTLFLSLASAVPVAEHEKRQNAEFDYVIIGVRGRSSMWL